MPRGFYEGNGRIVISVATPPVVATELNQIAAQFPQDDLYLFGHSLGGFILAKAVAQLTFTPKKLVFVGIRHSYPPAGIRGMLRVLFKSPKTLIDGFFSAAAPGTPFVNQHIEAIQSEWPPGRLQWGLSELNEFMTPTQAAIYVHGDKDEIAPIAEVQALSEKTGMPLIVISEGGHLLDLDQVEARVGHGPG